MNSKRISLSSILFLSEEVDGPRISDSILQTILKEKNPNRQAGLAQANLQLLGTGAARFVYDIGGNKVLKLSPLKQGQNKKEVEIWNCVSNLPQEQQAFFAKVYQYDSEGFRWLIAEKIPFVFKSTQEVVDFVINKIFQEISLLKDKSYSKEDIENDLLFSKQESNSSTIWNNFLNVLDVAADGGNPSVVLAQSSWFNNLVAAIRSCGINIQDFWEDNMGRRANGEFVILDFGA
jgi:hypothetical protein